jgi:hypothetical protein
MPKFKVVQERDAIIRFETEIEAETPQAAWEHARNWACPWVDAGHFPLDSAQMAVCDLAGAEVIPFRKAW